MSEESFVILDLPTQELGVIEAVALLLVSTATLVVAYRLNGSGSPALRLAILAFWLLSILRVYSASSYIWGPAASEAGILVLLRHIVLGTSTIILIIALALMGYYIRRLMVLIRRS